MKRAAVMLFLLLAGLVPADRAGAQEEDRVFMSAFMIAEALTSPRAAMRDRGAAELPLMDADTARALGTEIVRRGVRESEVCLRAVAQSDCVNGAIVACVALDARDMEVRTAALDALIRLHPRHIREDCDKLLRPRVPVISKLITEEGYARQLAEAVKTGEKGLLEKPVERALCLMALLDRHLGADAMPLLMNAFADHMLGDEGEEKLGAVVRLIGERLRRGAAAWLEALWVADAAVQFNYSAAAPFKDRQDSVNRLRTKLKQMQQREITLAGEKYTGMRYGDYLAELFGSDVSETRAAAYLRTRWWRGDEVIVTGEGYAEAVDTLNAMNNRELMRVRRDLYRWWHEYRKATEVS
jgi:hypothetical protein